MGMGVVSVWGRGVDYGHFHLLWVLDSSSVGEEQVTDLLPMLLCYSESQNTYMPISIIGHAVQQTVSYVNNVVEREIC